MRRGPIRRSFLSDGWLENPVWGQSWPVYIHPGFQGGPGETGDLYSDWLLTRDAVADERTGSFGDASRKHSWVTGWFQAEVLEGENSYWPLTSAGSLRWKPSGANSHWLMAQAGSLGQPCGMPNFHWLMWLAASSHADEVASVLEACDELLRAACSQQMQGAGEVRSSWRRVAGGMGSWIQLRRLSYSGRVTIIIHEYI